MKCHLLLFHNLLTASLTNRSFILLWIDFVLCILCSVLSWMSSSHLSALGGNMLESLMQISLTADATEAKLA